MSKAHSRSADISNIPNITNYHLKNVLIQTSNYDFNSDNQNISKENETENNFNIIRSKKKQKQWKSINSLSKTNFNIDYSNKKYHLHLFPIKPLSQQILNRFRTNNSLIYNNHIKKSKHKEQRQLSGKSQICTSFLSRNKSEISKGKLHLDCINIPNSPNMNLIKLKRHKEFISTKTKNKFRKRNEMKKEEDLNMISNKESNINTPFLIINGGNYFSNQQTPKLNNSNDNNNNMINKCKKEKYLRYIENNLEHSRKLYIQNNYSYLRGNRQQMRKLYNPHFI